MQPTEHNILNRYTEHTQSEIQNLVARVAHDISSPIAVLEISLHQTELHQSNINILREAIQRIRDITNNMLNQYHGKQALSSIFLLPLLEQVISLKRYEWSEKKCNLVLCLNTTSNPAKIYGNACEIKRILSNLLNNAIEACRTNIIIQVCVIQTNEFIELNISDNGSGILYEKINDYLNGESTKHAGKGLGLSSAKQYMESVGGKLLVTSQINIGTTVTLKFKKTY